MKQRVAGFHDLPGRAKAGVAMGKSGSGSMIHFRQLTWLVPPDSSVLHFDDPVGTACKFLIVCYDQQ